MASGQYSDAWFPLTPALSLRERENRIQSVNILTALILPRQRRCLLLPMPADQKPRDFFNRFLGRGKADALQRPFYQRGEPFHCKSEVRAAPISHNRMDFIHNEGPGRGQHFST